MEGIQINYASVYPSTLQVNFTKYMDHMLAKYNMTIDPHCYKELYDLFMKSYDKEEFYELCKKDNFNILKDCAYTYYEICDEIISLTKQI